uniref:DYW domain-containing protein n=1 Tax=Kalanchoe fedtschenkoi TaxID=63787 RepID=A0A7N0TTL2_KALFE
MMMSLSSTVSLTSSIKLKPNHTPNSPPPLLQTQPTPHPSTSALINGGRLIQAITALDPLLAAPDPDNQHPHLLASYSLILKSCIRTRNFALGRLLHANLARSGLNLDSVIRNSFISLYSKCGDFHQAGQVFEAMGDAADLVSWSAMISCYANNGMEREAIEMFVRMLEWGVYCPNEYCFTAVIRACSNFGFFGVGEVVYGFVLKTGYLDSDVCVGCSLIDMFVKGSSDLDSAYKLFDRMSERNVVCWTLMITRFMQTGFVREAVDLFIDMILEGHVPDRFTLSGVISACAEMESLSIGKQLHSLSVRLGLVSDVCVACSLVDMYAKCSKDLSLHDSRQVFERMHEHNVMSWTAMITGCVQSGGLNAEAISLFIQMVQGSIVPNHFTLSGVLKACGNLLNLCLGEQIHAQAMKRGLSSIDFLGNSIISMYSKCGKMEDARKAFDLLFEKNLVSYNALVDGYAKNMGSEESFELFNVIEERGIGTNGFTFASLLSGAASVGALSKGEQIHARVFKSNLASDICVSNALVSMYTRCGDIEAAFKVFDGMECRNVISWTSVITGFAKHGFATRAIEQFREMLLSGIKPNEVTYVAVLSACSHSGMISQGIEYFDSMFKNHGIMPRMEHYACVVDIFGRSGLLAEAIRFIDTMPVKPDALVWRTLLGACRIHGNLELGKHAAQMILEQEPQDPAAYILLSNLYASEGKWDYVADIRKNMKQRHMTKEAGYSWVENENKLHRFHVGETSHPQAKKIYEELDELAVQLKEMGYIPNTDFVLHDVEEEQKEKYLFQHSEKLAVAYGLISTSGSKPIRVFKNLRVCGDCHTAIKYISLARGREIVLRDSNRFHHFKNGECSCNDYW